jgi:uncharacterized protein involved in outer membrane biogenesis
LKAVEITMIIKRVALIVAVLLLLLIVVPFLVPMGTYINQVEQLAAEKVGVPVAIKSLHVALLPTPRANVGGIVIGANAEIQMESVSAVLDVTTLFNAVRVVTKLEVNQPVIKKAAVGIVSHLLASKNGNTGAAPIAIRRIVVHEAKLEWPDMKLPLLDADIAMSDATRLKEALISSTDGKLAIEAKSSGDGYVAHVKAQQWVPPAGLPLVFDAINIDLEYSGQTLDVPKIEAELYRGKLDASARLDWKKDWHVAGKFKNEAIELGDASRLFTKAVKVSGRISGNGAFSSTAKEAEQLVDKLVMDYQFNVAKGILHGMDLAKAASLFITQGGHGGETQFDELSGKLHTAGKQIELRDMKVASGLLSANGKVKITPTKTLDGMVDVELKKGLALVTVPLKVSGTVDAPVVMPTKAALAGAAAGTALLGPMGTSIGMKTGSALDKLFGGKK